MRTSSLIVFLSLGLSGFCQPAGTGAWWASHPSSIIRSPGLVSLFTSNSITSGTTNTWPSPSVSGNNVLAGVSVGYGSSLARTITGVTWGAVALTNQLSVFEASADRLYTWAATGVSAGVSQITVTYSGSLSLGSFAIGWFATNVGGLGNTATATAASSLSVSNQISAISTDVILDSLAPASGGATTWTVGAGQSLAAFATNSLPSVLISTQPGAATVNNFWTNTFGGGTSMSEGALVLHGH